MSERDDIEFDFFEESDTRETQEERPRRGPRPPVRPPTGLTPLLRLIGLISFAILIILLLVLWVNGCRENKRKDAYRHYVEKVQTYGQQSQRLGRNLNALLTQRGTKESDVESELSGLARQQEQIASAARGLNPPGRLRAEDAHMLDALDLRSNGLRGMTDAFRSTASSKNAGTAGGELAVQMQRLIASDVIWQDLFKEPTKSELQRLGVTGVNVPDSIFLANPDIATTASMKSLWQRIHGTAAGGGTNCSPRGTGLVSTKALPSGKELSDEQPEHDSAEHGPRVHGHGQELRLCAGGRPPRDADDSAEPEADQVAQDDSADRLGQRGERLVQRPRAAAARSEDVAHGRGRPGPGRDEHDQQLRELSGSVLRSVGLAGHRLLDRCLLFR